MKSVCKITKIIFLTALFSALFCFGALAADEGAVLSIDAPESAVVGDTIDVDIVLSGAENIYGGKVYITFDRKKLEIQSMTEGSALSKFNCSVNAEDEEYQSVIQFSSMSAYDANGVLATLTFNVTAAGDAAVNIVSSKSKFSDSLTTTIDCSINNAVIAIEEIQAGSGDVNGDNSLDLIDAIDVLKHYDGSEILEGDALEAADINGSGEVDREDAAIILKKAANIS